MVTHRHHPSSRPFPAAPSTRRHASSQPYSARSVCCPLHFQDTIFPLASLSKSINPSWNPRARLPRAAAATWNLPKAPSLLSPPPAQPHRLPAPRTAATPRSASRPTAAPRAALFPPSARGAAPRELQAVGSSATYRQREAAPRYLPGRAARRTDTKRTRHSSSLY